MRIFVKTVGYALLLSVITFSVWTGLKFLQYSSLQGLIHESTQLGLSNFQIEIASAGLAGLLAMFFVQRKRHSKRSKSRRLKMTPMVFAEQKNVHPLMTTPRPSRDSNFVIRKTRHRGRISRNRMGERLPPSNITQPSLEETQ